MSYLKFKHNTEPTIQYESTGKEKFDYDELLNKYCDLIELKVLGWVPKELLEETDYINNINAIDLAIKITNS